MNATKRLTPKQRRRLEKKHPLLILNPLAERAGAAWLITDEQQQWIVRARSTRGEEWAARG